MKEYKSYYYQGCQLSCCTDIVLRKPRVTLRFIVGLTASAFRYLSAEEGGRGIQV